MIGIFDSGVGGLNAFYKVRATLPGTDILYLADRKNAPYGTKSKEELLTLVKRDINVLRELGAHIILIACCTASTVYESLSHDEKKISVPIILPSALEAARGERIAVIATERTVSDKAFSREILKINPFASVLEISAQSLVRIVESSARGCCAQDRDEYLDSLCHSIRSFEPDTLVLGCTHFSHVSRELESRLPGIRIVSPALIGAKRIISDYMENYKPHLLEKGRTVYL